MSTNTLIKDKIRKRQARHKRVRAKISGTASQPRLSVFKSNKHIQVQLVDDVSGKTLASANDGVSGKKSDGKSKPEKAAGKSDRAFIVGKEIAQKAKALKIETAVFDRGGNKYHGRVKKLAEGARSEGLKF